MKKWKNSYGSDVVKLPATLDQQKLQSLEQRVALIEKQLDAVGKLAIQTSEAAMATYTENCRDHTFFAKMLSAHSDTLSAQRELSALRARTSEQDREILELKLGFKSSERIEAQVPPPPAPAVGSIKS